MNTSHSIEEPSVLLLDDEVPALRALSDLLQGEGINVVSASSTSQAIKQVEESEGYFSALIMDVKMNDEADDGLDATREIQYGLCRTIPAIIVSAYSQDEEYHKRAQQDKLQIKGWLEKPILDDVHDQLMQHLDVLHHASKTRVDQVYSIFEEWCVNPADRQDVLRRFIIDNNGFDPMLVTNTLINLEEQSGKELADFIAQINFLVYEKTVGSLLEQHGPGYVAFWKGKKVGFAATQAALIKEVFETMQTTDFFFAPVTAKRVSSPAGPTISSRPFTRL